MRRRVTGIVAALVLASLGTVMLVVYVQSARGDIPEGLQEVTVPLEPARALGGRIAAGDTVGVFLSFDPFDIGNTGEKTANVTHLELHKVVVTRVQLDDSGDGTGVGSEGDDDE